MPGAVRYAAVFGSLAEGAWELRVRGDADPQPVLALTVVGGTVVEALWPPRAEPAGAHMTAPVVEAGVLSSRA